MNYAVLDPAGICVNYTVWDGVSEWQPPESHILVDAPLQIGSRHEQDPETLEWVMVEAPPPPPPVPQWVQFGELLAADDAVNTMVATAASAAPVLHLMLGVGLGQAAQGDPKTFLAAWSTALASGLATPTLAAHVVDLGTSCDLPAEFLAQLNP
jgi:hypothetical protein